MRRIRERLSLLPVSPPSPTEPTPPIPAPVPVPSTQTLETSIVNPLTLPDTMNPEIFLSRLRALRESREDTNKKPLTVEDDPSLPKKDRITNVLRAIFNTVTVAKGNFRLIYYSVKKYNAKLH